MKRSKSPFYLQSSKNLTKKLLSKKSLETRFKLYIYASSSTYYDYARRCILVQSNILFNFLHFDYSSAVLSNLKVIKNDLYLIGACSNTLAIKLPLSTIWTTHFATSHSCREQFLTINSKLPNLALNRDHRVVSRVAFSQSNEYFVKVSFYDKHEKFSALTSI